MQVNEVVVNGVTELSLVNDTVSEDTLLENATAHDASGKQITGKLVVVLVDSELNAESTNAIQNKAVAEALLKKLDKNPITFQTQNGKAFLTENSEGGNLRLTSFDDTLYMEQDCYNNNTFRCYVVKDGTTKSVWYYDSVNNIFNLYPKLNAVNTPIPTIYTGTLPLTTGSVQTVTLGVKPKFVLCYGSTDADGLKKWFAKSTSGGHANITLTNTGFTFTHVSNANPTEYYIALA